MSALGSELVTNGDLATNASWTFFEDFTYRGDPSYDAYVASEGTGDLYQAISITAGKTYRVAFDATVVGAPTAHFKLGGGTTHDLADGANSFDVVCQAVDSNIYFYVAADVAEAVAIDNVSVKEVDVPTIIEEALFYLLKWDSAVSGQVSSRIYPQIVPQDTSYPALRYNQISGVRQHTLADTDNMVPARFQIDCYGSSYANARTIADAVRGVLDNYNGTCGSMVIQCIHLIDEGDYFKERVGVDQLRRYGKTQEYMIWYNE